MSDTVRQRWHGKSVLRQAGKPSPFAARGVSTSFAGTPRTGESGPTEGFGTGRLGVFKSGLWLPFSHSGQQRYRKFPGSSCVWDTACDHFVDCVVGIRVSTPLSLSLLSPSFSPLGWRQRQNSWPDRGSAKTSSPTTPAAEHPEQARNPPVPQGLVRGRRRESRRRVPGRGRLALTPPAYPVPHRLPDPPSCGTPRSGPEASGACWPR